MYSLVGDYMHIIGKGVIGEELVTSFKKKDKDIVLTSDKWESGNITSNKGLNEWMTTRVRTKDYIDVKSNTNYIVQISSENTIGLRLYTKDNVYISLEKVIFGIQSIKFKTPSNCAKIRLICERPTTDFITTIRRV